MEKKINCFVSRNYENGAPDNSMENCIIQITTAAGDRYTTAGRLATLKEHEKAAAAAIQLLWTGAAALIVSTNTGEVLRSYNN